jgi:hypothetical protein
MVGQREELQEVSGEVSRSEERQLVSESLSRLVSELIIFIASPGNFFNLLIADCSQIFSVELLLGEECDVKE